MKKTNKEKLINKIAHCCNLVQKGYLFLAFLSQADNWYELSANNFSMSPVLAMQL